MNATLLRLGLCALFSLAAISRAAAQTATNDWFSLDAAGAASASANYTAGSTLGQPDGGLLMSASYRFTGGFWALDTTPSAPPPTLFIRLVTPERVLIYWPSPSTGFVLQENDDPGDTAGWTDVPFAPDDDGTFRSITTPPSPSPRFFRLRKP